MPQDSIEAQLKNIKSWSFIPNKNKILPVLEANLSGDEYIIDIIDGFFNQGHYRESGSGDSGLILVTDRNIFLIRSGSPGKFISLRKERTSIGLVKNFSSLTVKIDSGKESYSFVTHLPESAVKNIFSASGRPAETEVRRESGSAGVINDLLTAEQNTVKKADVNPAVIASGLLYSEVKKISTELDEFRKIFPGTEFMNMYCEDIYTISGLCGMTGRELSDNEMLFICMALSAGEKDQVAGSADFLGEIMRSDSFPLHLMDAVNRRMETITSGISRMDGVSQKNLKSIEYLAGYDREHNTKYSDKMAALFYEYSQCLLKADGVLNGDEEAKLKDISALIQKVMHSTSTSPVKTGDEEESIEQVMEKINALVGMDNIKDEIKSFINFINIRSEREKQKLPVTPLSLHAVFYGPPGTGKTTIARLLGRVYRALGLLKSGHLVETDRAGLVAGYVGQTAIKTDELVSKAKDGVLFIDEAYTLIPENGANDYGRESVDTILKRMEDMREGFAVIAAGYTDEMERFINSNPGLKSRFSRYFYFNHYRPEELVEIFKKFADNVEFKLTPEAEEKLNELIKYFYDNRTKSFGNARFVRNVFDKIVQNQADRLVSVKTLSRELLCEVTGEDIPVKEDFIAEQFS